MPNSTSIGKVTLEYHVNSNSTSASSNGIAASACALKDAFATKVVKLVHVDIKWCTQYNASNRTYNSRS